jgi:hypothetical protein
MTKKDQLLFILDVLSDNSVFKDNSFYFLRKGPNYMSLVRCELESLLKILKDKHYSYIGLNTKPKGIPVLQTNKPENYFELK